MFCYLSRPLGSLAGSTHCTTARFFDASVVRYPSSYSYPGTYATRSLTPVQGYAAGTTMFSTIDISSHIISFSKYAGGVLGPNGLIYFVPRNAWNIGVLNPSSSTFTNIGASLDCNTNGCYNGGVLGPNGLIYFVPYYVHNVGKLHLGNTQPAVSWQHAVAGSTEEWSSLLSPHFNKF